VHQSQRGKEHLFTCIVRNESNILRRDVTSLCGVNFHSVRTRGQLTHGFCESILQ